MELKSGLAMRRPFRPTQERSGNLLDEMHASAMLLFHLLNRNHFAAEVGQLGKLLLDGLEPFVSLSVSDLRIGSVAPLSPILLIQFLNVSDFRAKPPYFFAKHFEVIHSNRIAYLGALGPAASNPS
jgi:hypothetical protein